MGLQYASNTWITEPFQPDYSEGHQMGLQYASYTWISRTIPASIREDRADHVGHQVGLQYASYT